MAGGKGVLAEFKRWPGYERSYRRAFAAAAAANRIKLGNDYNDKTGKHLRWDDGNKMFDWWITDNHETVDPDQGVLFE